RLRYEPNRLDRKRWRSHAQVGRRRPRDAPDQCRRELDHLLQLIVPIAVIVIGVTVNAGVSVSLAAATAVAGRTRSCDATDQQRHDCPLVWISARAWTSPPQAHTVRTDSDIPCSSR